MLTKNFGVILSKAQQREIKGGNIPPGGGNTFCASSDVSCSYYESGTGMVTGHCEENSKEQCVCHSANSSVVSADCQAA